VKCLVTGGAGFIGSHLVDRLLMEGHQVVVMDNLSHGRKENVPRGARLVRLDIRSPKVERAFKRYRPQVVFHLAAQMEVRKSVEDPMFDADVNILGLVNVLRAAVEGGCPRVIFASSGGAVYGEQQRFPATEEHPTKPLSPYGVTKRAGELYLDYFSEVGLKCASLRLANVYGPRQDPLGEAGVVAIFARKMLNGETPTINGTGKQTRDYVYVDDVVDAFVTAFARELTGPFNVGTGIETDVNRLFDLIAGHAGFTGTPVHGPAKEGEQMRSVISAARLSQVTEWEPGVPLDEGLKRTVAWFQAMRR
jgi:UDP-glucose 4-epimerase